MDVKYFRPRRDGPEAEIENTIVREIHRFVPCRDYELWAAGSLPVGAGLPDLLIAEWKPQIMSLAKLAGSHVEVLAYLRAVTGARLDTIADRLVCPKEAIATSLKELIEAEVVFVKSGVFKLTLAWRDILPDIVTVEVKVRDWRKGFDQARRNHIFSHRSYVALPDRIAKRIRSSSVLRRNGIGLMSVTESFKIRVLKAARRRQPRVWSYYYRLAQLVAINLEENQHAVPGNTRTSKV